MGLRNINQMMPGVGFSMGEAQAIQDQTTSLGALAVPPSGGGQSINTTGNLNVQISRAGIQPASTAADIVLAVFTIAANAFDAFGRTATLQAAGSLGVSVNSKRVKIIFGATTAVVGSAVVGGTAVADTGPVTTSGSGWALTANVAKDTAANTQIAVHNQAQIGTTVAALLSPSTLNAVESAPIIVAVTGNAATATTDITFNWFELTWSN